MKARLPEKVVDTHIYLPEPDYEWVRRKAYEEHKSVAQILREIVYQARINAESDQSNSSAEKPGEGLKT